MIPELPAAQLRGSNLSEIDSLGRCPVVAQRHHLHYRCTLVHRPSTEALRHGVDELALVDKSAGQRRHLENR
jgi:hypothetical protein